MASLNPCFSGCWSRTRRVIDTLNLDTAVLILVLVDVGLGLVEALCDKADALIVLILVLVDVGLGHTLYH